MNGCYPVGVSTVLRMGRYRVDLDLLQIHGSERSGRLSALEGDLLRYLWERDGQVVSQQELLVEVWGYAPTTESRAAYHAMARLRQRLEEDPGDPKYLLTVRGAGFRLVADPPDVRPGRRSDLPRHRTRFFGREAERARVLEELTEQRRAVVSLLGLGGVGKTRLAVEVASRCGEDFERVGFCDLSAATDEEGLWAAVCASLGIPTGLEPLAQVVRIVREYPRTLLVLDNAELLVAPVGDMVVALLDRCPGLQVLVTSREPLAIRGEVRVTVAPLEVPGSARISTLTKNAAVRLFADRARAADLDFEVNGQNAAVVAHVVRKVEGWPLALELAAGHLHHLGLSGLSDALATGVELRAPWRDVPERQSTLRRTIAWSVDLLDDDDRRGIVQLAVFRGVVDMDAVVSALDVEGDPRRVLRRLVECGLVQRSEDDRSDAIRFRLLEPIRQWCREVGVSQEAFLRHRRWAVRRCGEAMQPSGGRGNARLYALATLQEDLHAAWEHALGDAEDQADLEVLSVTIAFVAWSFGRVDAALARVRRALEDCSESARLWHQAGLLAGRLGQVEEGRQALERAVALAEAQALPADVRATFLAHLAVQVSRSGLLDAADALFLEALELGTPGSRVEMAVRANRCVNLALLGRAEGVTEGERALGLCRRHGDDVMLPVVLHNLSRAHLALEDVDAAVALLERAVEVLGDDVHPFSPLVLVRLGEALSVRDPGAAVRVLERAVDGATRRGEARVLAEAHLRLAGLAQRSGRPIQEGEHLARAEALAHALPREHEPLLDRVRSAALVRPG